MFEKRLKIKNYVETENSLEDAIFGWKDGHGLRELC